MKKLVAIYTDKETSEVTRVDIKFPPTMTEEQLANIVEEFNNREGQSRFVVIKELDDITYEAVKFLCGKEGYRTTYDLSSLKSWFTELSERIEEVNDTYSDIEYEIRQLIDKAKDIMSFEHSIKEE